MVIFIFLRQALIFCGVALTLAVCADLLLWTMLIIGGRITGGGLGLLLGRNGWIGLFAGWWILSFLIALPLATRIFGMPFRIHH